MKAKLERTKEAAVRAFAVEETELAKNKRPEWHGVCRNIHSAYG